MKKLLLLILPIMFLFGCKKEETLQVKEYRLFRLYTSGNSPQTQSSLFINGEQKTLNGQASSTDNIFDIYIGDIIRININAPLSPSGQDHLEYIVFLTDTITMYQKYFIVDCFECETLDTTFVVE